MASSKGASAAKPEKRGGRLGSACAISDNTVRDHLPCHRAEGLGLRAADQDPPVKTEPNSGTKIINVQEALNTMDCDEETKICVIKP